VGEVLAWKGYLDGRDVSMTFRRPRLTNLM
jgi:hypothetical protein